MHDKLTAIVVAVVGGNALERCAAALRAQVSNVILVERGGAVTDSDGTLLGKAELNIPAKRKRAAELASTPLVALIEDTVVPLAGWAAAVSAALSKEGAFGCGGPVSIACDLPASSRALALSEYGAYNERKAAGTTDGLPGCNFAFRRTPLLEAIDATEGLVDQLVYNRLQELGGELIWAPQMAVTFRHANREGARLATRFRHGRIYASSKEGRGFSRRAVAAMKAVLLPPVLTIRSLRDAAPAERRSVPTLSWLILQHGAWAAGELAGSVLGRSPKGLGEWQ
jgi:hypothetical protein